MQRRNRRRRRGNALVEFVFMLPFYATMFFGTLEFGNAAYQHAQLTFACREGVRATAVGKTLTTIRTTVKNTSSTLGITDAEITIEYNTATDGTGSWVSAADDGTNNTIATGYPCRVKIVNWPYHMLTGSYFSYVPNYSSGSLQMNATEIAMRE